MKFQLSDQSKSQFYNDHAPIFFIGIPPAAGCKNLPQILLLLTSMGCGPCALEIEENFVLQIW